MDDPLWNLSEYQYSDTKGANSTPIDWMDGEPFTQVSSSSLPPVSTSIIIDSLLSLGNNASTTLWDTPTTTPGIGLRYDGKPWEACDDGSPIFNCTITEYLAYVRGPQNLPIHEAIIVTIVYVIIFITGVVGNLIVCVVIIRHSTMHTATNYYLFSLAVSDLIFLLLGVPYEVSLYWHQYPYLFGLTFCKLRALISEASTYVSVLTIVAFTMERFLAICHPLHLYTMSGFKRAVRIIAALWLISFFSAVPFAVYTKIYYATYPIDNSTISESAFCAMLDSHPNGFPLWEVSTCVFFVIPMTVILVLYMRIGLRIRSRTKHTQALGVTHGSMHGDSKKTQSRKAIIRMLAAVVLTFFVCWAPFHAQRLLFLYGQEWDYYKRVNEWLFVFGGSLYYISCTINPILYNVMSHRYRIAFKETLCGRRRSHLHANGFPTDHSSFRETTIARTNTNNNNNHNNNNNNTNNFNTHENSQLIRSKSTSPSMRSLSRHNNNRDRNRLTGNSVKWKERPIDDKVQVIKEEKVLSKNDCDPKSDVLVVWESCKNGLAKCYTTTTTTTTLPPTNGHSTTASTTAVPVTPIGVTSYPQLPSNNVKSLGGQVAAPLIITSISLSSPPHSLSSSASTPSSSDARNNCVNNRGTDFPAVTMRNETSI